MTRPLRSTTKKRGVYIVQLRIAREQGLLQEFSDGGLTLPTRGLECGFRVLEMPEISEKIVFHLPTGAIAPLATPWHHPCSRVFRSAISAMNKRLFSIGASSPSGKYIHESFYTETCMFPSPKCLTFHLPLSYLRELGESRWI